MSDARAKAEARRAKILARESTRLLVAKGEKSSLTEDSAVVPVIVDAEEEASPEKVVRERPLAARRNMVKSAVEKSIEEEKQVVQQQEASAEATLDDANLTEDIGKSKKEAEIDIDAVLDDVLNPKKKVDVEKEKSSDSESKPKIVFIPKTVRQVEEEVARNTAKFDESMVSQRRGKRGATDKEEGDTDTAVKKVSIAAVIPPLLASHFMGLIRFIIIVLLGVSTGYYIATHSSGTFESLVAEPSVISSSIVDDPLSNLLGGNAAADMNVDGIVAESRTWSEWGQDKLAMQFQCSLSAIMLARWISSLFAPSVDRMFPAKPQSGGNMLTYLFSLYSDGVDVVLEMIWSSFGDMATHFVVMVLTVLVVNAITDAGVASSQTANVNPNVEL